MEKSAMNQNNNQEDLMDLDEAQEFEEQLFGLATVDWFLAELVELAELGFSPPLTLTVGGSYISGKLISAQDYFEEISKIFKPKEGDSNSNLKSLHERFIEHAKASERKDEYIGNVRRYIHLKDAKCHTTDGKAMPINGVLQRFKLTAVCGFSFGKLEVETG
jgi:hypothetical protein